MTHRGPSRRQQHETRFRVHLEHMGILDTRGRVYGVGAKQDVVVYAVNVAHAIKLADDWAIENWPGATVEFRVFRNPRPPGGYTLRA